MGEKNGIHLTHLWNIYLTIKQFQIQNFTGTVMQKSLQKYQEHHLSSASLYPTHWKQKLWAVLLHFIVGSGLTLHWYDKSTWETACHRYTAALYNFFFNYTDHRFQEWITQYPTWLLLCQHFAHITRQHFQNAVKESVFGNILLTDFDKWRVILKTYTWQFLGVCGMLPNASALPWELRSPWG